jgi:hypothetical protein
MDTVDAKSRESYITLGGHRSSAHAQRQPTGISGVGWQAVSPVRDGLRGSVNQEVVDG